MATVPGWLGTTPRVTLTCLWGGMISRTSRTRLGWADPTNASCRFFRSMMSAPPRSASSASALFWALTQQHHARLGETAASIAGAVSVEPRSVWAAVDHFPFRRGRGNGAGEEGFQLAPQLGFLFVGQVLQRERGRFLRPMPIISPQALHMGHGQGSAGLFHGSAPPLIGQGLDVLETVVIEIYVEVAGGGAVDGIGCSSCAGGCRTASRRCWRTSPAGGIRVPLPCGKSTRPAC